MSHLSRSLINNLAQFEGEEKEQSFIRMMYNLVACTFQTVIGYVCLDIMLAISLHFVQKEIGSYANAGFGLAYTIVNVAIIPLGLGLNQSLNVNAAQSIGASKDQLSKKYLAISFYTHIFYFVPFFVIIMLLRHPFSLTIPEQDREQTIYYCYLYMPYLLFSSLFAVEFEAIKAYLIAYKKTYPFMFIHTFTVVLHYFWCYLLISKFKFGVHGGGIATLITEILNCLIILIWVYFSDLKQHFHNFSFKLGKDAKNIIISFLTSSFAIISHIYLDFFVFFFMNFIALRLGNDAMNA